MAKGSSLLIFGAAVAASFFLFPKNISSSDNLEIVIDNLVETIHQRSDEIIAAKVSEGYYLEIPRLGTFEEIAPDVDPFNMGEYMPKLVSQVAQASGTNSNLTYLFAHSSNYVFAGIESRAIFANINDLRPGDSILINNYGKVKEYAVATKRIVEDTDLSPLEQSPATDTLVLQTCWPEGSSHTRLIVTAKPVTSLALR